MSNRTLAIFSITVIGTGVLCYMLGRAHGKSAIAKMPAPTPKQDGFMKRALLAVCMGLGEGAGKTVGSGLVGRPTAVAA